MGPDNFYSMRKNDELVQNSVCKELGALKNTHCPIRDNETTILAESNECN